MAYKVRPSGMQRDEVKPSEIAAQRPLCATRFQCEVDYTDEREMSQATIRGDRGLDLYPTMAPASPGPRHGDLTEDRIALFNRQLRGGHAGRNDGDE